MIELYRNQVVAVVSINNRPNSTSIEFYTYNNTYNASNTSTSNTSNTFITSTNNTNNT